MMKTQDTLHNRITLAALYIHTETNDLPLCSGPMILQEVISVLENPIWP